jgi:hypothetical protein
VVSRELVFKESWILRCLDDLWGSFDGVIFGFDIINVHLLINPVTQLIKLIRPVLGVYT